MRLPEVALVGGATGVYDQSLFLLLPILDSVRWAGHEA